MKIGYFAKLWARFQQSYLSGQSPEREDDPAIKLEAATQTTTRDERPLSKKPRPKKNAGSGAKVELHSNLAQKMLMGRQNSEPRIPGLFLFAKQVQLLKEQAIRGDSKAQQLLGAISVEIEKETKQMIKRKKDLQNNLDKISKIHFAPLRNEKATSQEFRFATKHAWQVLNLIALFDEILCIAAPYSRAGLMNKSDYNEYRKLGRGIRRIMTMPLQSQNRYETGDRDDET